MAGCCHSQDCSAPPQNRRYRQILWIALVINGGMFIFEILAGIAAGSSSLQADALDFLGDAANYGVSLLVLGMTLQRRATASLIKGGTMGLFGLWVSANTLWHIFAGTLPEASVMGLVGMIAFAANVLVAALLYAFRDGDSNMRSVWICSRNDALSNLAVVAAAGGVFGTGTGWPDYAVAAIMAALALSGAWQIIRHAISELRPSATASNASP